jgi:hypothetical protein
MSYQTQTILSKDSRLKFEIITYLTFIFYLII